jgi:RNA polymerase sigma-70 factor, ECF subfamily
MSCASVVEPTDLHEASDIHHRGTATDGRTANPSWANVVDRIHHGDSSGMEELYKIFRNGVRFFLYRQLGPRDLDDKVHDVFVIVVNAIKRGDLREPERLMGFVRTILHRQAAGHIDQIAQERRREIDPDDALRLVTDHRADPEREAIDNENREVAARVLRSICKRDREVLIRFYLKEQRPETICAEMGLTTTQFRLIKSRAKLRYTEMCQKRFKTVLRKHCSASG